MVTALPVLNQSEQKKFRVLRAFEFLRGELPNPEWLVADQFPHPSMTILIGEGGARKSLYAQALSVALVAGAPFFDSFEVPKRRRVVYLQTESGRRELQRRFKQIAKGYGVDGNQMLQDLLIVTNQPFDLSVEDDFEQFKREIIDAYRPDFLVVDALIDFHTCDENSSQEMSRVAANLRSLRDDYGASILVIHHTNKSQNAQGAAMMRGTTALWNAMDGRWTLVPQGEWSSFTKMYQKEGGPEQLFSFRVDPDELDCLTFEVAMTAGNGSKSGKQKPTKKIESDRTLLRAIASLHEPGYAEIVRATTLEDKVVRRRVALFEQQGKVKIVRCGKAHKHIITMIVPA